MVMNGYVTPNGDRGTRLSIYEGINPVTVGHGEAGTPRAQPADAERLAARLRRRVNGRNDETRSVSFGAYLTGRWLPAKHRTFGQHLRGTTATWNAHHSCTRARRASAPPAAPPRVSSHVAAGE